MYSSCSSTIAPLHRADPVGAGGSKLSAVLLGDLGLVRDRLSRRSIAPTRSAPAGSKPRPCFSATWSGAALDYRAAPLRRPERVSPVRTSAGLLRRPGQVRRSTIAPLHCADPVGAGGSKPRPGFSATSVSCTTDYRAAPSTPTWTRVASSNIGRASRQPEPSDRLSRRSICANPDAGRRLETSGLARTGRVGRRRRGTSRALSRARLVRGRLERSGLEQSVRSVGAQASGINAQCEGRTRSRCKPGRVRAGFGMSRAGGAWWDYLRSRRSWLARGRWPWSARWPSSARA